MKLLRHNQGIALVEFTLALPLLLLVMLGAIELSNAIFFKQKLSGATDNIHGIINIQDSPLSTTELQRYSQFLPRMVRPYTLNNADYRFIITNIYREPTATFPAVFWQKAFGGAPGSSRFNYTAGAGATANAVTLAELNMNFRPGDQVILVEVFARYRPLISGLLASIYLDFETDSIVHYITPIARPRIGRQIFDPDANI